MARAMVKGAVRAMARYTDKAMLWLELWLTLQLEQCLDLRIGLNLQR
jgi:hypothetical protein